MKEQYEQEEADALKFESSEAFFIRRCFERGEFIHEISYELAQVRSNYEDVCERLKKYEPDFVPKEERPYNMDDRMV
jgi:hypothetical protein